MYLDKIIKKRDRRRSALASIEDAFMDSKQAKVEELKKDEDIRRALEQTGGTSTSKPVPEIHSKHKLWIVTYFALLFAGGGLYYLLRLKFFAFTGEYNALLQ